MKDLIRRITRIQLKDIAIPDTDNLRILGAELKIRLAMISDIITEIPGRRGQRVKVTSHRGGHRYVPIWSINKEQDAEMLCEVKVGVVQESRDLRNRTTCIHSASSR